MIGQSRDLPPVNVGDVLDVRIEAVGAKGDGIARVRGFIIFVPNAKEGDEVRVKISRVLKKVGFAEIADAGEAPTEAKTDRPAKKQRSERSDNEQESYTEGEDTEDFGEENSEY